MKTVKFILSIALVAFTIVSFGMDVNHFNPATESELEVENWMISDFSLMESELEVENWMSSPFYMEVEEETIALEKWMSIPFEESLETCSGDPEC